jgi:hypothetical protein
VHADDLEDQQANNYPYDDIGNLISDVQEEIEKIEWTVYGGIPTNFETKYFKPLY